MGSPRRTCVVGCPGTAATLLMTGAAKTMHPSFRSFPRKRESSAVSGSPLSRGRADCFTSSQDDVHHGEVRAVVRGVSGVVRFDDGRFVMRPALASYVRRSTESGRNENQEEL